MSARGGRAREMNFAIRYLSKYTYDADVVDNLNALRVKPAANSRQRVDEFSVRLSPEVRLHRHADYFGTEVVEFEVSRPHRELVDRRARARQHADAASSRRRRPGRSCGKPAYREAGGEFLLQTDDAPDHPVLGQLLAVTRAADSPLATLMLISELIPDRFEYRRAPPTSTRRSPHVLDVGAGVCQDFVHLGLSLLRHHGIAARYVSGYLFATRSEPAQESVEVDTHAWLEALLPRVAAMVATRSGWAPTRPTAASPASVTSRSATAATTPTSRRSRASTAASPTAALEASVTMTRLDGLDPAAIARA